MTWDGGLLDGVFIHNNTFFWNPPVEGPPVKMTETEFGGSRSNSVINNVIYSTVPSMIHSGAGRQPLLVPGGFSSEVVLRWA